MKFTIESHPLPCHMKLRSGHRFNSNGTTRAPVLDGRERSHVCVAKGKADNMTEAGVT